VKVVLLGRYNAQGLDNDYELLIRVVEGNDICFSEATFADFYMCLPINHNTFNFLLQRSLHICHHCHVRKPTSAVFTKNSVEFGLISGQ